MLKELDLQIGDEISLLELDERVEKLIDDEEIETMLTAYSCKEILEWGVYVFYTEEYTDVNYRIYFEIIKNTGDEDSIIKITGSNY